MRSEKLWLNLLRLEKFAGKVLYFIDCVEFISKMGNKKLNSNTIILSFTLFFFALCNGLMNLGCNQSPKPQSDEVSQTNVATSTLIPLEVTEENKGKRCAKKLYDLAEEIETAEEKNCRLLQEDLADAAFDGNSEEIKEALKLGANVNATYYQSSPALETACMKGHTEIIELLLDNGAEINKVYGWEGMTPLKKAVTYRKIEVVKLLIKRGVDVCLLSKDGNGGENTSLDVARELGFSEIEEVLVEAGADNCSNN